MVKPSDIERAYPYFGELQTLWDLCLRRLERLEELAAEWLKTDDAALVQGDDVFRFVLTLPFQTEIFAELEGLLAAYARLSLILYPASSGALERGLFLRRLLGLPDDGPLADRDLRDSWMHFDERLDAAVAGGRYERSEVFIRASQLDEHRTNTSLRVIVVDRLEVLYVTRTGERASRKLRELRPELQKLGKALGNAETTMAGVLADNRTSQTA